MQSFTTILAIFAATNAVSGSPLLVRDTCGSAPAGSGSQTPLAQPSNCQTAQACQSACTANGQCQSFLFGFVDNAIKCSLFAVPAAQVPKQASQNLIAYDKACGSVPAVVPTAANPTGINQGSGSNNNNNNNNNNNQQGQQSQQGQNGQNGQNGQSGQNGQNGQQSTPGKTGQRLAVRNTCGATPAGSNSNQAPLSQPSNINSSADCLTQCKANPSCKSFEFGTENNAKVCRLFNVPAAQVPPPTGQQSFQVFDSGCSI